MNVEEILKAKYGMEIPAPEKPKGLYTPVVQTGNLCYVSGQTPSVGGEVKIKGVLGADLNVEQGQEAARHAMLNCLAYLKAYLGSLEKIKQFVQVVGYVRSASDFTAQPLVINGASQLILDLFEKRGAHTRLALGTNQLPGGAAVEVTCIVEV